MTNEELREIKERCDKAIDADVERNEIWNDIPGFENYQVSDMGNVRSYLKKGNHKDNKNRKPRLLKVRDNGRGYLTISLTNKEGKYTNKTVHSLVMMAFVGEKPIGKEIAHLNGIKNDNRLLNLKYVTHKENEHHKKTHNTNPYGERNPNAKLYEWQVAEIKYLSSKSIPQGRIASLFNISHKQVYEILNRKTWKETEARTDIPAMLAEIDRLKKRNEILEIEFERTDKDRDWCYNNWQESMKNYKHMMNDRDQLKAKAEKMANEYVLILKQLDNSKSEIAEKVETERQNYVENLLNKNEEQAEEIIRLREEIGSLKKEVNRQKSLVGKTERIVRNRENIMRQHCDKNVQLNEKLKNEKAKAEKMADEYVLILKQLDNSKSEIDELRESEDRWKDRAEKAEDEIKHWKTIANGLVEDSKTAELELDALIRMIKNSPYACVYSLHKHRKKCDCCCEFLESYEPDYERFGKDGAE